MGKLDSIKRSITRMVEDNPGVKFYIISEYKENGQEVLSRTCMGFNAFELYGLLNFIKEDVSEQIKGNESPEIVNKYFIKDDQEA